MDVTVISESEDKTAREVWIFFYSRDRHALVLSTYSEESRPTRRHRYFPTRASYRLDSRVRDSRIKVIPLGKAPLPESVKIDARRQFCKALAIKVE